MIRVARPDWVAMTHQTLGHMTYTDVGCHELPREEPASGKNNFNLYRIDCISHSDGSVRLGSVSFSSMSGTMRVDPFMSNKPLAKPVLNGRQRIYGNVLSLRMNSAGQLGLFISR